MGKIKKILKYASAWAPLGAGYHSYKMSRCCGDSKTKAISAATLFEGGRDVTTLLNVLLGLPEACVVMYTGASGLCNISMSNPRYNLPSNSYREKNP